MNKATHHQERISGVALLVALLIISACATKPVAKPPLVDNKPLEKEVFIIKPLGYAPTIKNFRTYLPSSFKLQIYSMKNLHNPQIVDTIYRFHQNKSEFFIYKNLNNRELFFAGNIYTPKIQLRNGVKVGMKRNEFYQCFTNLKPTTKDTVRVSMKQATNSVNFIFRKDKLAVIKLDNYID